MAQRHKVSKEKSSKTGMWGRNPRSLYYLNCPVFSKSLETCEEQEIAICSQEKGFPGSSAGKESSCQCRSPWFDFWVGKSPGEGIGYPPQYSWASLVSHMKKNLPAMWETWVRSLSWEDSLEEGVATHCSIPAWRIPWTEEPGRSQSLGSQFDMTERQEKGRIQKLSLDVEFRTKRLHSSSYKYIQGTKEAKLKELKYDDEILTRGYKRNCKENEKL